MECSTSSYFFDSDSLPIAVKQMQETAHYKCPQAVIECGSDAKIVERRGEVF
jgi:hypothetical protein